MKQSVFGIILYKYWYFRVCTENLVSYISICSPSSLVTIWGEGLQEWERNLSHSCKRNMVYTRQQIHDGDSKISEMETISSYKIDYHSSSRIQTTECERTSKIHIDIIMVCANTTHLSMRACSSVNKFGLIREWTDPYTTVICLKETRSNCKQYKEVSILHIHMHGDLYVSQLAL
jgi:hypothetical protein